MRLWYWLIGAAMGAALYAMGCGTGETVVTAAIACHQKGIAIASKADSCNAGLIAIEDLIATDPDCVAVYQGRSSGLHCRVDDGGPDGQ